MRSHVLQSALHKLADSGNMKIKQTNRGWELEGRDMLQVSVTLDKLVQPNLAQGPFHCLILERKWDISHYGLEFVYPRDLSTHGVQ